MRGAFKSLALTNQACIFERKALYDRAIVCINMADAPIDLNPNLGAFRAKNVLTGEEKTFQGKMTLPPCTASFWRMDV